MNRLEEIEEKLIDGNTDIEDVRFLHHELKKYNNYFNLELLDNLEFWSMSEMDMLVKVFKKLEKVPVLGMEGTLNG